MGLDFLKRFKPSTRNYIYTALIIGAVVLGGLTFWFNLQHDIDSNFVEPSWWGYIQAILAFLGVPAGALAKANLTKTVSDLVDQLEASSEEEALAGVEVTSESASTSASAIEAAAQQIVKAVEGKVASELMVQAFTIESSAPKFDAPEVRDLEGE